MDMEMFKAQLKELAGKDGEKAWKIVEDWYTKDGRSRRVSLHDLHGLSMSIVVALDMAKEECAREAERYMVNIRAKDIEFDYDDLRTAIMGKEAGT